MRVSRFNVINWGDSSPLKQGDSVMKNLQKASMPIRSPWGRVQHFEVVAPFLTWVSTASHGGCKVSQAYNRYIPSLVRTSDGWYEEDCAWCIPYVFLARNIREHNSSEAQERMIREALPTLKAWYWREYEVIFSDIIPEGECSMKDEYIWRTRNVNNWCKIAACAVDLGVKIWLTRGGKRGENEQEIELVMSRADYASLKDSNGRFALTDEQLRSLTCAR